MPMEVEHILATFRSGVRLHAEATFADSGVRRELCGNPHELSEEGLVVGLCDRCDMSARKDEDVEWRARGESLNAITSSSSW